jgi:Aspartyl/Asparaginyl beta-hydroxylase
MLAPKDLIFCNSSLMLQIAHSSGRNYMLSTLTPLSCPSGCGIVVNGQDRRIETHGPSIILDNTFVHHVYNHHESDDRYCLMAECYHPSLNDIEMEAIRTLFAAKDRFTVLELELAPWGYCDDVLERAIKTDDVHNLDFWRNFNFSPSSTSGRLLLDRNNRMSSSSKKSKQSKGTKGFGKSS